MAQLRDENYEEATRYFEFVKTKYPFSRFSTLAELRLADVLFAQEKYASAIDAYQMFVSMHPTHPRTLDGYAAFRVCLAQSKQMPSDWFLTPRGYQRDQTSTLGAMRELKRFLTTYPNSPYAAKARPLFRKAVHELVAHELYVARFYLDRDKPKGAILRLEGVLKRFPEAGDDAEVMLLLGKTYFKMDQLDRAQEMLRTLVERYPSDINSKQARLYLRHIHEK